MATAPSKIRRSLIRVFLMAAVFAWLYAGAFPFGRDPDASPVQVAHAAVLTRSGTFAKSTAAGAQAVTGVGFLPKAVIFFWTKQAAQGFTTGDRIGVGFASGPGNQRVVAVAGDNGVGTTNYGRRRSATNVIMLLSNGNPTLASQASLTSLDADGFTLDWTTNDGAADIIHYVALGGDEITNALAGTFMLSTSNGNQAVTGVGFQPDFVMFLSSSTEAVNTNAAGKLLNIGMMTGATGQAAVSVCGRDNRNTPGHAQSQQRTNVVLAGMTTNCAQDWLARAASLDADGFTVRKSDAPSNPTPIFYLALQGGNYKVGAFDQRTSAGTQAIAGLGFEPQTLFMASFNRASAPSIAPQGEVSIGAATGTTARDAVWAESRNGIPSVANVAAVADKVLRMADGPATTRAEADLASFDADGFTLNWTTADATARQIVYWTAGGSKTILGGGIEPPNVTIPPGAAATDLDAFTFQTTKATDAITDVTVALSAGSFGGLSRVDVTNDAGTVIYGSILDPGSDTLTIATIGLTATTAQTQYKVRVTPKSHAAMPAPPGSTYAVTGTVTGWTGSYRRTGTDPASATVTIDNLSPAAVTGVSGTPSDAQVSLTWTNPADADFSNVIVLRSAAPIIDVPAEGSSPVAGDAVGSSVVRYTGSAAAFVDTGLTNGATYHYLIFSKDTSGNYAAAGGATGPHVPLPGGLFAGTAATQIPTMLISSADNNLRASFTFIMSAGTATVTNIVLTETGTVSANAHLSNVRLYYKTEAACSTVIPADAIPFNGAGAGFDASEKASIGGSMDVGTSRVCLYVRTDVNAGASDGQTVEIEITDPSADVTLASGTAGPATPVAMSGTTTLTAAEGTSSPTLTLQMADPAKDPTEFWLAGGVVWMREGAGPAIALTSGRVTVTDLTFTNLSYPGTPGLVRARMNVKYNAPSIRQEYIYEKLFYASASPRR